MKVLFVASEFTPLAKVGGLGDVIGSLPMALAKLGVSVSVIIPRYEQVNLKKIGAKIFVRNFPVNAAGGKEYVNLYKTKSSGKVTLYLLENNRYLSRGPIYFEHTAFVGSFKEIQRFLFFSKAVCELLPRIGANIVHCNDWHTGALVAMLARQRANGKSQITPKTVFTIHNLANQGTWGAGEIADWLGPNNFKKLGGAFNFMAEGVKNADIITTVSETYAREIQTKQYGARLHKFLKKRNGEKMLVGILNGIDYSYWPPVKRNKEKFQKEFGFKVNNRSPIFGLVARLTRQKGINLVAPIISKLVQKYGAQFVFLGQGEAKNEKALRDLAKKFPKNVFVKVGFDEKLAHEIYAQSDFFLMPSIFEPSGLGQMIAMRYGTIPIVRATGGLKDSVVNEKTGFVFKKPAAQALYGAIINALGCYADPKKFNAIIKNCKKQDFSWSESAKKYLKIYKGLKIHHSREPRHMPYGLPRQRGRKEK